MKKKYPLVTLGFTTFNSEKTIERALLSGVNQDYENLEILIVDDNSSDQTVCKSEELLKKIGVNYKIIKHKTNKGIGVARNSLIKNSRGEFLVFFDSDDHSIKTRVSSQICAIKKFEAYSDGIINKFFNSPLCYSDREIIFSDNKKIYCKAMAINEKKYVNKEKLISSLLFCHPFPINSQPGSTATCTLSARVSTLKLLSGFNTLLRRYEDLDLAIRALMNDVPLISIPQSLVNQYYYYRDYKSEEVNYEIVLVNEHKGWLDKRNLFDFSINFVNFKKNFMNLNLYRSLFYLFLLFKKKPTITLLKIIFSLRTFFFSLKMKIKKNVRE